LFPEKQIVLRTGRHRTCFTVSTAAQAVVAMVAGTVAIWQGVVTTQWLDSAATIAVKDYQIVDLRVDREAALESMSDFERRFRALTSRIATEMQDIERDLALLAEHDRMTGQPVAAYTAADERSGGRLSRPLDLQLARLEESLFELRARHSDLLVSSAQTASDQLDRLESALTSLGIDTRGPTTETVDLCSEDVGEPDQNADEAMGRGGLFVPAGATPADYARPREAFHMTLRQWNDSIAAVGKLPLGRPVENMRISSTFGRRRDPFNRRQAVHQGIDYAGASHAPVRATGGGVVKYAGRNGRYGKLVEIDHGHGLTTRYAHLAEISVRSGQIVERGSEIGLVGSTGRSTGPHLHYEVRVRNQPRDPLKFIEVGTNVFKRNHTEVRQG